MEGDLIVTKTSRTIFPLCGITYADCVSVAGVNQREAARKLGIAEDHFRRVINMLGMGHWYPDVRPRPRCVSKEDVIQVASEKFTRRDAAHILGISYGYLRDLIQEWDLGGHFISGNEARSVARKGYCSHNLVQSMR